MQSSTRLERSRVSQEVSGLSLKLFKKFPQLPEQRVVTVSIAEVTHMSPSGRERVVSIAEVLMTHMSLSG